MKRRTFLKGSAPLIALAVPGMGRSSESVDATDARPWAGLGAEPRAPELVEVPVRVGIGRNMEEDFGDDCGWRLIRYEACLQDGTVWFIGCHTDRADLAEAIAYALTEGMKDAAEELERQLRRRGVSWRDVVPQKDRPVTAFDEREFTSHMTLNLLPGGAA